MSDRSRVPGGWTAPRGTDVAIDVLHLIREVSLAWSRLLGDFAASQRLHPTDVAALVQLLDAQRAGIAATPGWLGEQMGMRSPAVTALIDRLESAGLVERGADPDRRRVRLNVTEQAIDVGWAFHEARLQPLLGSLQARTAQDLEAVRSVLTDAVRVLTATPVAE